MTGLSLGVLEEDVMKDLIKNPKNSVCQKLNLKILCLLFNEGLD